MFITRTGVDSPITKKSKGSRPPFGMPIFIHNTSGKGKNQTASWLQKWHFVFKSGISDTKTAFRLQIFSCHFTKWRLGLQSGFSLFN